jgi:hypothetical protein
MEIREPIKEYKVTDYDFAFLGGSRLPITINPDKGDIVTEYPDRFIFNLAEKPNPLDSENPLTPERITILKRNLNAYTEKDRMQREPTAEEVFDMQRTIHKLVKGVQ